MSFAENVVGSFIEIGCTIILMNLFSPVYLASKCKACVIVAVLSVLMGYIGLLEMAVADIGFYIGLILVLSVTLKRNIGTVLFEFLLSVAVVIAIEYLFVTVFFQIQGTDSTLFRNRLIQLFLTLGSCLIIGINKKTAKLIRNTYTLYQQEIQFISVMVFTFASAEVYLWKTRESTVLEESLVVLVFIIICFSISFLLFKKLIENKQQKENIRLQEQYMEMTENLLDRLYTEKHDFNKHLQVIQGMCEVEKAEKAVEGIDKYIDSLRKEKKQKSEINVSINTGNGIVNALLYSKHKEAKKRQINFLFAPNGTFPEFPCEAYELVQIIANMLDNAFDAVEVLPIEERNVVIYMNCLEHKRIIEVRNTYKENVSAENAKVETPLKTTKLGERRGYGLQIVKAITQKYHGKFDISKEGNEVVARTLL